MLPETPSTPDVTDNLEYEDTRKAIQKAIDSLPERCRIIFCMSRFDEKSHKEIAAELNISTKTIENQITRALKTLRSVLGAKAIAILAFMQLF